MTRLVAPFINLAPLIDRHGDQFFIVGPYRYYVSVSLESITSHQLGQGFMNLYLFF